MDQFVFGIPKNLKNLYLSFFKKTRPFQLSLLQGILYFYMDYNDVKIRNFDSSRQEIL